jgi:hypothetical protein
MAGRDEQLDEVEALVVSVISGARALRRQGKWGWNRSLSRLQVRVAALARQLEEMKHETALPESERALRERPDDDWLPAPAN